MNPWEDGAPVMKINTTWREVYDTLANSGLSTWVENDDNDWAIEAFDTLLWDRLSDPTPEFKQATEKAKRVLFDAIIAELKEQ